MAAARAAPSETASAARQAVEWSVAPGPVLYPDAVEAMEERVAAILARKAPEQVRLLEHPPLYTAGTSARADDLLDPLGLPVYRSGRGGQYTYHGPGQRVAYVMLDLAARGRMDLRCFVRDLEQWLIDTLAVFGVAGMRREGRVGIWVEAGGSEAKIAAIGVRVRRWVTFHGVLAQRRAPTSPTTGESSACGIREHGVTSLAALGVDATMDEIDRALQRSFEAVFRRLTRFSRRGPRLSVPRARPFRPARPRTMVQY